MKLPTLETLEKRRAITMADALAKFEAEDWHGCADAMMDLREIDAMLNLLRAQASSPPAHLHQFVYDMGHDHDACACGETRTSGSGRTDQRERR